MNKRTILHIILWVGAVICFVMTFVTYYQWREAGGKPDDPARFHPWIYLAVGVICVAIWYFTREKEEEVSITRGG